jgi:hypothetical protein
MAALILFSGLALARATSEVPYAQPEVYSTALRFLRVDKGCKIIDQDANAAFVIFECADGEKPKRGSLEIWKSAAGAHLQLTLGDDPHYMELRWLELLERKLREERGTPPAAPHRPDSPDGGT